MKIEIQIDGAICAIPMRLSNEKELAKRFLIHAPRPGSREFIGLAHGDFFIGDVWIPNRLGLGLASSRSQEDREQG